MKVFRIHWLPLLALFLCAPLPGADGPELEPFVGRRPRPVRHADAIRNVPGIPQKPAKTNTSDTRAKASPTETISLKRLERSIRHLTPLHEKLTDPEPGSWRARFPEAKQSFRAFLAESPPRPTPERPTFYVQPVGDPDPSQMELIRDTADAIRAAFGMRTVVQPRMPLARAGKAVIQTTRGMRTTKIQVPSFLVEPLFATMPDDGALRMAITAVDLAPARFVGPRIVLGLSLLAKRVGIVSYARLRSDDERRAVSRRSLRRALKVAVHESYHTLGLAHCSTYACLMNGTHGVLDVDRNPFYLCPDCLRKICWACGVTPAERYRDLYVFCHSRGLAEEADFYARSLEALGQTVPQVKATDSPYPVQDKVQGVRKAWRGLLGTVRSKLGNDTD